MAWTRSRRNARYMFWGKKRLKESYVTVWRCQCAFSKILPICGGKRNLLWFCHRYPCPNPRLSPNLKFKWLLQSQSQYKRNTGYRLMVRTLVFHTNNAGSIPASLTIPNQWLFDSTSTLSTKRLERASFVKYSFRFVSLIAPSTSESTTRLSDSLTSPLPRRLLVKRSYLILSWLAYLTAAAPTLKSKAQPRVAILPPRQSMYTLTKAPMAHKTNSKEQFLFKFYNFKFSFTLRNSPHLTPSSILQGAHSLIITKKLFPVFETNLLFLKSYEITYPVYDSNFFSKLS